MSGQSFEFIMVFGKAFLLYFCCILPCKIRRCFLHAKKQTGDIFNAVLWDRMVSKIAITLFCFVLKL